MCKKLIIDLDKHRPYFCVDNVICLYDSGAVFPVWCSTEDTLKIMFPNVMKLDYKFPLGGFGGTGNSATLVDVYMLEEFKLSEDLVFKNLCMALSTNKDIECDLILSDSLFNKMKCSVNRLNPNSPVLEITHEKDIYYIKPTIHKEVKTVYDGLCNFTQQPFDKEDYLKDYLSILPEASVESCMTMEDCDSLLHRLGLKKL